MGDETLTRQEIEASRIFESGRENTIDRKVVPIVFLPGVMGSRLKLTAHNNYWDPDSKLRMVWWLRASAEDAAKVLNVRKGDVAEVMSDKIKYDARLAKIWAAVDPAKDPYFYGRQRGWGGVAKDYYRELLTSLEATLNSGAYIPGQHPVYAVGYDWRKSNNNSGAVLARRVRYILERHGAKQVILVTHSMGGLVARAACSPGSSGIAPLVKGVVHVVQPINGATVAYRRFAEGLDGDRDDGIGGKVMAAILGGTWWGYSMIMSGTDGPLQLLPNQLYPNWLTLPNGARQPAAQIYAYYRNGSAHSLVPPLPADAVREMKSQGVGASPNASQGARNAWTARFGSRESLNKIEQERAQRIFAKWEKFRAQMMIGIAKAEAYHTVMGGYAHPKTVVLYAGQRQTEVGYDWSKKEGSRRIEDPRGGDGTVPVASAKGLNAVVKAAWAGKGPPRMALTMDVGAQEHSGVFADAFVRDRIVAWINAFRLLPDR
jgi:pimeloyl-ACP methyl ester carboxylesterase